jgi:hypothetical protein
MVKRTDTGIIHPLHSLLFGLYFGLNSCRFQYGGGIIDGRRRVDAQWRHNIQLYRRFSLPQPQYGSLLSYAASITGSFYCAVCYSTAWSTALL